MDIDQPPLVAADKTSGQNAHEPGQYDQGGLVDINGASQRVVKRLPVGKGFVINYLRRNAV